MSSTAMYVELLVVGLGGLVWAGLFISCGITVEWADRLACLNFKNHAALILPFMLSAAYVLGILIDKAGKFIAESLIRPPAALSEKYAQILIESELAATTLNYMRSKIRIMRGYCFNWLLIGVSGSLFMENKRFSVIFLLVCIEVMALSILLYIYNERLYNRSIHNFTTQLKRKNS